MGAPIPKVGEWYQTPEGDTLEVVAWDLEAQTVEVQFFDGTIEEYDTDAWSELGLRPAQPQEDWSGVDLDQPAGKSRRNPLDDLEK